MRAISAWLRRAAAAALAMVLGFAAADAQEFPGPQQAQLLSQPTHAGTGLAFPSNLAGARLVRTVSYAEQGHPELGYSYHYAMPNELIYTIYLYGERLQPPPGPDSRQVANEYETAVRAIRAVAQLGRYKDINLPDTPERCTYGLFAFRCVTFSAVRDNQGVYSRLLVTGYRGYIFKMRVDWSQQSKVAARDVERLTQTLLGAILK